MARVYGQGYAGGGGALAVLLWAHFFGFVGVLLAQLLVARRQEHALAALLVAAAVGNVLINLWAIPRYGEMGAAWASFAAYALPFAIGGFVGPARSAVRVSLRSSIRPFIGVALLLALLVALQPSLAVALVVTAVSWPVILLVTRSTSWAEVRSIVGAARRSDAVPPDDRTGPGALPFP
jgi:O-antigen/teichoic acid export membrane protein